MTVLVTGSAGFIGAAVCEALIRRGEQVVGLDSFNQYYDVTLKRARSARLSAHKTFRQLEGDVADFDTVAELFARDRPSRVIHLAAQAGVRYAAENPRAYLRSNLDGFLSVLEACRQTGVGHLVYASSSSVYGANTTAPSSEHDAVSHPLSLYAATKQANEGMAHAYAHMFGVPCTGLRFFTVYGPWGRPDMALFSFTRAILEGRPLPVFNEGRHERDFTYVEDAAARVLAVLDRAPSGDPAWNALRPDPATSAAPWRIYNVGAGRPTPLLRYIEVLEQALGRRAVLEMLPAQPGDVIRTEAGAADLDALIGKLPVTPLEEGIARFVAWYRDYYAV